MIKVFVSFLLSIFFRVGLFVIFIIGCITLYSWTTDPLEILTYKRSPHDQLVAEVILDATDGAGGGMEFVAIESNLRLPGSLLPKSSFTIDNAFFRKDIVLDWIDDGHLKILTEEGSRPIVGPNQLENVRLEYGTYPLKEQ